MTIQTLWPSDVDDYRDWDMEPRRRSRVAYRCVCGPDLPGYCPGPCNCPLNAHSDDEGLRHD